MARCAGTLPIGQVMIAKIRLHDLRHNSTPRRLLSEIGAELGSPLPEFGQLGPQAPDLAVDARQLRPGQGRNSEPGASHSRAEAGAG